MKDLLRTYRLVMLSAALLLVLYPLLHPNNTCQDWLLKWGQLSEHPLWIPTHQLGATAFLVGVVGCCFLVRVGPASATGLLGTFAMAIGLALQGLLVLSHATAVSRLGAAFANATDSAEQRLVRIVAEAFVGYDVAVSGVASLFISGGAMLLAWSLYRPGSRSGLVCGGLAAAGSVWALQYWVPAVSRISTGEWGPYMSLALWFLGVGLAVTGRAGSTADTAQS